MLRAMGQPETIDLVARAERYSANTAIVASDGRFSYAELLAASQRVAAGLLAGSAVLFGR